MAHFATELTALVDFAAVCHREEEGTEGEECRGTSGLHLAAYHDRVDIAKHLVGAGCPLDGVDLQVRLPSIIESVIAILIWTLVGEREFLGKSPQLGLPLCCMG